MNEHKQKILTLASVRLNEARREAERANAELDEAQQTRLTCNKELQKATDFYEWAKNLPN